LPCLGSVQAPRAAPQLATIATIALGASKDLRATMAAHVPLAVLRGHASEVTALAFLPPPPPPPALPPLPRGGATPLLILVSGAADGTLGVWDAAAGASTGALSRAWRAHTGGVVGIAADARRAAPPRFWSHGRDGCIHLWELASAAPAAPAAATTPTTGDVWDEAMALLGDLVLGEGRGLEGGAQQGAPLAHPPRQAEWTPRKLQTLRVGFGSFCAASFLLVPPPPLAHAVHSMALRPQDGARAAPPGVGAALRGAPAADGAAPSRWGRSLHEIEATEAEGEDSNAGEEGESGASDAAQEGGGGAPEPLGSGAAPAPPRERLFILAPGLDGSRVDIWDAGDADPLSAEDPSPRGPLFLASIGVAESAARAVVSALLEGTPSLEEGLEEGMSAATGI
jgi:hypothetical protein